MQVRVGRILRSTRTGLAPEEIAEAAGADVDTVRAALEEMARRGDVFRLRYRGAWGDLWRWAPRPLDGSSDPGGSDTAVSRVRSAMRAAERAVTARQIARAAGVDLVSARRALERLMCEGGVMRIRHRDDAETYWRVPGAHPRPVF